jgi:hypothetical protein
MNSRNHTNQHNHNSNDKAAQYFDPVCGMSTGEVKADQKKNDTSYHRNKPSDWIKEI